MIYNNSHNFYPIGEWGKFTKFASESFGHLYKIMQNNGKTVYFNNDDPAGTLWDTFEPGNFVPSK